MLQETEIAILAFDLPECRLKAGDVGTVMLVHGRKGYEAEFMTLNSQTVAVTAFKASQVRPITTCEVAHVRSI